MYHCCTCSTSIQVDIPRFKVGDTVRVSGDVDKVQSLQHGHGNWSEGVLLVRKLMRNNCRSTSNNMSVVPSF